MKKFAFILITAILLAAPSVWGAGDFLPLHPDMAARIEALRQAVKAEGGTYEVGYSTAMDRPLEHLTGLKVPPGWNKSEAPSVPMLGASVQTLPTSYDWRALNGVTPIKNQGNCGDCWAFSTVGPMESQILLQNGTQNGQPVVLSEQYLVSCNVSGWNCNGGWFAHDYHMDESGQDNNGPGAVLASADPYSGTSSKCAATYSHPYRLSSWAYVGSETAVPSTTAIKQAIYTYGPVSVGVYAGPKFQAYSSGVFNTNETGTINHAVVLVGWNDNPPNGQPPYWILRNSWGTTWGLSGYMNIAYGVNQVGYAANFIEYAATPNPPTPPPTPPPAPPTPPKEPYLSVVFQNVSTSNNGLKLSGNLWVENTGAAATAGSFQVLLYLSPNTGGASKSLLGTATIPSSLPPNYYVNLSFSDSSRSTSFNGQYLIAVIEPGSVLDSNPNDIFVSTVIQKGRK
jgi:C1A family cysteine protease